jgi:large subunit ribosomal protein L1
MSILEKIEEIKSKSKRNFVQTVDLSVNLKNIDLSKPENRFTKEVILPHNKWKDLDKEMKICVITSTMKEKAKKLGASTIDKKELDKFKKDKKAARDLSNKYDFFLAEAPLMVEVGKILGPVLGPRGKMPKPFPPGADIKDLIDRGKRTLFLKITQSPVIHAAVGNEKMEDKEIEENIQAVLEFLEKNLPKGKQQISSIYLKLTMGPSVKVR